MRKRTTVLGIVFILIVATAAAFKNLHLPGSGILLALAIFLTLAFVVSYIVDKLSFERSRSSKISHLVLSLALFLVIVGGMLTLMKYEGAQFLSFLSLIVFSVYLVFFAQLKEGRKLKIQKDRQLASILFTDIVGFTKMMGDDEAKTLQILDENRVIQKKLIRKYRGRWIKEMGDGSMAVFFTVSETLQCAIDIQNEIAQKQDFDVRMGIHVSEILFRDEDIFGDGVNVAARISALASRGQVYFSDIVYQNIRNREELDVEFMGEKELKNVNYPIRIYGLSTS